MFIAVNWGLFIYAVAIGHVVEIALGYYMSPLVSVLLGGAGAAGTARAVRSGSRWRVATVAPWS